jgi:hypothetical protein
VPSVEAGSPDDVEWLRRLIDRSPLLPEAALRRHWSVVAPWLSQAGRYELAAALLAAEQTCS